MSTPLNPPGEWQSLQVSGELIRIPDCVRLPKLEPPNAVTWPIAFDESWHAVQLAAFGEITSQVSGSV